MSDIDFRPHSNVYPEYLRLRSVIGRTGLSRATIYRLMSKQKFPRQIRLAERAVGWRCADIDRWSAGISAPPP
jgi:prophage regulatory protein